MKLKSFQINFLILFLLYFSNYFINFEKKVTVISILIFLLIFLFRKNLFNQNKLETYKFIEFEVSNSLVLTILFILTILLQNHLLSYETITWDVSSYLVASQEIGLNKIPFETQWESKGPLLLYIYYFLSNLTNKNYIYFKLINDVILFFSVVTIYFGMQKLSQKNKLLSIVSCIYFLLVTSHEWFLSEFSEIYCLIILGIVYLIFDQNNLQNNNFYLIGFLFSILTLINQGAIVLVIPYLIRLIYLRRDKGLFFLLYKTGIGFLVPYLFFIFLYLKNNLLEIFIANYVEIPLGYTSSSNSSISELLVVLRRIFQFNQFLYYFIFICFSFLLLNFFKIRKISLIFDINVLNFLFGIAFYFIAGHNYAHHLFYLIFYFSFLFYIFTQEQRSLLISILFFALLTISYNLFPNSILNLASTKKLYENYPLRSLSEEIDQYFDTDYKILALDYVLILFYLDKPNVSYIIHPGNHYEEFIVDELIRLNKIKTNEFNHISYLIETEPEVIICNATDIINGEAVNRDFYNCAVDDYKKNYYKLETEMFKSNPNLNLYKNPYEKINVYLKINEN